MSTSPDKLDTGRSQEEQSEQLCHPVVHEPPKSNAKAKKSIMKQRPAPFSVKGLSFDAAQSEEDSVCGLVNPHPLPLYNNEVRIQQKTTPDISSQTTRLASSYKNRQFQRYSPTLL